MPFSPSLQPLAFVPTQHSGQLHKKCLSPSRSSTPEGSSSSPAENAAAERIRRAKEYKLKKEAPSAADNTVQNALPGLEEADTAVLDEFNRTLAQQGEEIAIQQQEVFTSALESARIDAADAESQGPEMAEQQRLQQKQAQEDYIKRNAKHISPSLYAKMQRGASSAQPDTFSRKREAGDTAGPLDGANADDLERRKAAMSGSDAAAASYLAKVASAKSDAAGLRPEMFTIYKEEEQKARGVEMITRDRTYDPQKEAPEAYKPKVSTWGVFPRPQNISQAFGGGRTIDPNNTVDSEARAKERNERLQKTILEYRKKQGLYLDPEEEAKWMAAYQAGLEMMQNGQLQGAGECFDRVSKAVPLRSKLGGEAQLQRAICLDSSGRNDEAYKLYMTLERHPAAEIQKGAKRMLFGFRAADNLKVGSMNYSATPQEWEQYFTRFQGDWNAAYVADEEEDKTSIYIAAAVIVMPLIFAAYLIFR